MLPEINGSGLGWFCRLFKDSLAMGKTSDTNNDNEVKAVCEATTLRLVAGLAPSKVVFIIEFYSYTAIPDLSSSTQYDWLHTIQCWTKIEEPFSYDWTVALQWVPRHVEIDPR
ncbi:reverse transcriptase [Trichonephila clavipes]|nr:reverse transcriptase [Trichonephila clavipes]